MSIDKDFENSLKFVTIIKNTIVYRGSYSNEIPIPNKCIDTGKVGIYMTNFRALAVGTMLERDSSEPFFIFRGIITKNIKVRYGKYATGTKECTSHFDNRGFPIQIMDQINTYGNNASIEPRGCLNMFGEIFLSDSDVKYVIWDDGSEKIVETHEILNREVNEEFAEFYMFKCDDIKPKIEGRVIISDIGKIKFNIIVSMSKCGEKYIPWEDVLNF